MVFLSPEFMVFGWFLSMVFLRFYLKQEFHRGVPEDMVFLRFLLPWPGHPWTPWVEPHFRYSDWPQIPYVNMTLFPLGIAPNASNRPRTLFRPHRGPALEQYGFFTVWLHGQVSKSHGFYTVVGGWFVYGFRFWGILEMTLKGTIQKTNYCFFLKLSIYVT